MTWLKNAVLDIALTALVITAVVTQVDWLRFFIVAYAGIMLFMKIGVYRSDQMTKRLNKKEEVPAWFNHLLYAIDVAAPLFFGFWLMAGLWAAVWLISFLTHQKGVQQREALKNSSKGKKKKAKR